MHDLFPALNVVRPAIVTGLLSILLVALDGRSVRKWTWLSSRTTTYLLALFAWAVLSIPGAIVAGHSFDFVFNDLSKKVLMALVIACAIRGPRDLERIAGVIFVAAALYAAVVMLRFDVGEGSDWRLGHLYYYDANDFATFAVSAMPLGVYFGYRARSWLQRMAIVTGMIVISGAFVRAGSRGGLLALVATALFIVLTYRAVSVGKRVAAIVVVGFVVLVAASDRYWTQMSIVLSDTDYNKTEETGRLQIWERGLGYVLQFPLLGVGADNFQAAEGTISPMALRQQYGVGVKWSAPHNSFLQIAAELGLPGLVLFVGMLVGAFRAFTRSPRLLRDRWGRPPVPPALKQALKASLLGFVVGAFFLSLAYTELLFTLIALSIAVHKLEWRARRSVALP